MPVLTVKEVDSDTDQSSQATAPVSNSFGASWTNCIHQLHRPILRLLHKITNVAAIHPKKVIASVVVFSVALLLVGFVNFNTNVDEDTLWTPRNSHPVRNSEWIDEESGFPLNPRSLVLVFHETGDSDILTQQNIADIFRAVNTVRDLADYETVCDRKENGKCRISGVTRFWNSSKSVFDDLVASDQDIIDQINVDAYPDDGTPVALRDLFGNPLDSSGAVVAAQSNETVVAAQSYVVVLDLINDNLDTIVDGPSADFEEIALDELFLLREEWKDDSTQTLRLEVIAERSFNDEFNRAIVNDIPLLPTVFVVMGIFTSLVFFRKDKVLSRSLLGFTAVISVLLSIMAGYGLMFLFAVPFTSMTPILPFVFFGVGLDDAFILTGSFFRLDRSKSTVERVKETVDDVGVSVFLTTLTSSLAFALGGLSTIPAIFWLCIYAVPTMWFILLFQLTFFMSCLVLDERRIEAGNRDCWRCLSRKEGNLETEHKESAIDRFMENYARRLMKPWVKVLVFVGFLALLAVTSFSTSKHRQAFSFTDVLPSGSYIADFFEAFDDYSEQSSVSPAAYFRFVDQSLPEVREQMEQYLNELVDIPAINGVQPDFVWFRAFKAFVDKNPDLSSSTFEDQLSAFMSDPVNFELYNEHLIFDETTGKLVASRCIVPFDNLDVEDVREQIAALRDQREVAETQPVNEGLKDFAFFTYEESYNIWEFYSVQENEITMTTLASVAAVTGVTLLLVPHWTAALFTFPIMSVLYIDLLGVLKWADIDINPVTYIGLIMSIGLLIDFILHVLLRYYESPGNRREKTVHMLKTMGSSVGLGAVTTFLGTLPLALSQSSIFEIIFVSFLGLVALGAAHGLIVLPVILSTIGPEDQVSASKKPSSNDSVPALEHKETAFTQQETQLPEPEIKPSASEDEVTA